MILKYLKTLLSLAIFLFWTGSVTARELPVPSQDVVLVISGNIEQTNSGKDAQFDLAMLREMRQVSFETTTLWTEGVVRFKGVPLADILARVGVTSGTIRAHAVNDYIVHIPVASVESNAPVVAYEMNGQPMSRRNKGPLWVVYPYDSSDRFRTETIYTRSIWQLDRIEIIQ